MDPTLAGVYAIGAPLGEGAAGRVFAAIHLPSGRPLAAKVLRGEAFSVRLVARFRREIEAMAALHHPGILCVHDHGVVSEAEAAASGGRFTSGAPWLVVDRADASLGDALPRTWAEARHVLVTALEGLSHAHARGVVHRDLKPGNVLLHPRMGRPCALLADFGVAVLGPTGTSVVAGTPAYMAPEQFNRDRRDLGPWTDLYAAGVLGWELVTGRVPYQGDGVESFREQHLAGALPPFRPRFVVPRSVEGWLRSLLERDPARRPDSAAVASAALEAGRPATRRRLEPPATWRSAGDVLPPLLQGVGLGLFGVRDVPFTGRVSERDLLWSELALVASEQRPRLVVVHGPSGLGASRLARWCVERSSELGVASTLEAHHRDGRGLPSLLARHHHLEGLSTAEAERRLSALGAPRPDRLAAAAAGQGDAVGAVYVLLRQLAADGPVVWWADDADQDPDAWALARRLLATRHAAGLPVLVVATMSDLPEAWANLLRSGAGRAIGLDPLPSAAVVELLAGRVGLDPALASEVADRCAGHPAQALDLVRAWVERGSLVPGPRGHRLARGADRLPDDLSGRWVERIEGYGERVGPAGVTALRIAALVGVRVEREVWARVCSAEGFPLDEGPLDEAVRRGWLVAEEDGWRFTDGLLRATLLKHLFHDEERRLRRACADALRDTAATGRAPRLAAQRIGLHLLAADEPRAALEPLATALEQALGGRLDVVPELLAALDRAMAAANVPDDDFLRGRAVASRVSFSSFRGEVEETRRAFDEMSRDGKRYGWIRRQPARFAVPATSARFFVPTERSLELLDHVDVVAPGQVWVPRIRGLLAQEMGRYEEALDWFLEAVRLGGPGLPSSPKVTLEVDVACALERLGRYDEAEPRFRAALATCIAAGIGDRVLARLNVLGTVARRRGYAGVHEEVKALGYEAEETGEPRGIVAVAILRTLTAVDAEDWSTLDATLLRLEHALVFARLVEPSIAEELRGAADRCAAAGEPERARQVSRLAARVDTPSS